MANWYSTYFETKDKEIVNIIKNGCTDNFYYDEDNGSGHCSLRWGLDAVDMEAIDKVATKNHSSFLIRSSDAMACEEQTWAYENGEETIAEVKEIEVVWEYVDGDKDDDM